MDMDYAILESENIPVVFQNQPRWVACLACTVAMVVITLSAVTVGAFIGYTYCYMEHRRGYRTGDVTHSAKLQFIGSPQHEDPDKRTINSVLFSSVLVSRLLDFGQALKNDVTRLPKDNLYL